MIKKTQKPLRLEGIVDSFDEKEGTGYISHNDNLYPVHVSALQNAPILSKNQKVTFEMRKLADNNNKVAFVEVVND